MIICRISGLIISCCLVDIPVMITCTNFVEDWLKGFEWLEGQIFIPYRLLLLSLQHFPLPCMFESTSMVQKIVTDPKFSLAVGYSRFSGGKTSVLDLVIMITHRHLHYSLYTTVIQFSILSDSIRGCQG